MESKKKKMINSTGEWTTAYIKEREQYLGSPDLLPRLFELAEREITLAPFDLSSLAPLSLAWFSSLSAPLVVASRYAPRVH